MKQILTEFWYETETLIFFHPPKSINQIVFLLWAKFALYLMPSIAIKATFLKPDWPQSDALRRRKFWLFAITSLIFTLGEFLSYPRSITFERSCGNFKLFKILYALQSDRRNFISYHLNRRKRFFTRDSFGQSDH